MGGVTSQSVMSLVGEEILGKALTDATHNLRKGVF